MSDRGGSGRELMPDESMRKFMQVACNTWFHKWSLRAAGLTDEEWQQATKEAWRIMEQGEEYPLVQNVMIGLIYELDARMHGGYTDTTRNKILDLIKGGAA